MKSYALSLVTLAALAVASTPAGAQLAIKGGLSFASTTESEFVPDLDTRTGFAAGVSLGIPLASVLEIRPEALFVQKGGEFSSDESLELNELNIPALLQVNLPITGLMPFIYAGPQAEVQLSCTAFDEDCVDTNSFRWGAVLGGGIRFARAISAEIRYDWTLSELSDDIDTKPRTLLILLGIHFGASK
ncbi:MAG TPA: porin family protein [Gemmatimonadales bacterium]|nr:porin family protein [Gemmatimonadales bacterium]